MTRLLQFCVGADIHRPIRTSVRILIWQDYKHGYTSACTARTISRTLARDTLMRCLSRPFDSGDTCDSRSTLHLTGMFRDSRLDTKLNDDDIFPSRVVTYCDSHSRANWLSLCPPQRQRMLRQQDSHTTCIPVVRIPTINNTRTTTIVTLLVWLLIYFGYSTTLLYSKP